MLRLHDISKNPCHPEFQGTDISRAEVVGTIDIYHMCVAEAFKKKKKKKMLSKKLLHTRKNSDNLDLLPS